MIIITGPGRSGTSVLAKLYKELGFDPGGNWLPQVRAGLEHGDFWRLNNRIAGDMHMTMLHPKRRAARRTAAGETAPHRVGSGRGAANVGPVRALARRFLSHETRTRLLAVSSRRPWAQAPSPRLQEGMSLADWDAFPAVVEKHRDQLVYLAEQNDVVKDPRFCFTLPVWLAAGARIEHVVITVRAVTSMVASRHTAEQSEFGTSDLRNSLTYGLGMALMTVHEYDQPHSVVSFPDFLRQPEELYDALTFPKPVSRERFVDAAHRIFDAGAVHDWRTGQAPLAPSAATDG